MKLDRIIWGILLLFIGGILLLDNFNVIEFYWRNVWSFWPIFLIILGVNILFNKNNSQTGSIISIVILVVSLSFLFVKGQEKPNHHSWWRDDFSDNVHIDMDDDDNGNYESKSSYSEPFLAGDAEKKTYLNISAGATSFELKSATDSTLIDAVVGNNGRAYMLSKESTDTANVLTFKMKSRKGKGWSWKDGDHGVDLHLNTKPLWEMNVKMGAGQINFDLANYKVRTFNFDGGAAELDVKIGELLPITDVNVKTGVADVKIEVPKNSGCRIKTKIGLSSKDFDGFTKTDDGVYETANYKNSTHKIFINLDGGLSSFEVKRY